MDVYTKWSGYSRSPSQLGRHLIDAFTTGHSSPQTATVKISLTLVNLDICRPEQSSHLIP